MASETCPGAECGHAKLHKMRTDMITLVVGPEGEEEAFQVHVDLAKQHSEIFAANLENDPGAGKAELRMAEHSAQRFKLFVAFLYTGQVYSGLQSDSNAGSESRLLAELWCLGHALKSTTFKDAAVDAMIQRRAASKKSSNVAYKVVAEHLQTQADWKIGVGKLLVDTALSAKNHEIYHKLSPKPECIAFYGEIICGLDRIRRGTDTETEILSRCQEQKTCLYHVHGTRKCCYRKMFPATSEGVRCAQDAIPQIDTIVTEVHVGSDEVEKFLVRKDIAIRHSRVLEKALNPRSDWKEADENVFRLPEESPEAFQVFLTFLDTGVIHLDHFGKPDEDGSKRGSLSEDEEWNHIAEAWLLGDRILSVSFKDAIVDKVISLVSEHDKVPTSLHRDIYKGSAFGSGMRRLLVDIAAYSWFSGTLADQPSEPECAEFFKDVGVAAMKRMTSALRGQALAAAPYDHKFLGCQYHDHDVEEKPCYKRMFG